MAETVTRDNPGDLNRPALAIGNRNRIKAAVPAGIVTAPIYVPGQCVVTATPGGGGTMLVEATWSTLADIVAGAARWFPWDAGTVSAAANQLLMNATAVRFTATTQPGVGEATE